MAACIKPRQLQYLHYVLGMNEKQISEVVSCRRPTVGNYRKKYGLFPKTFKSYPKCPTCGTSTNYLVDEGLCFCPNCLKRVNAQGNVVTERLAVVC